MTRQFTAGIATGILMVGMVGFAAIATHVPTTTAANNPGAARSGAPGPRSGQGKVLRIVRTPGVDGGAPGQLMDTLRGMGAIVTVSSVSGQTITATLGGHIRGAGAVIGGGPAFFAGGPGLQPMPGKGLPGPMPGKCAAISGTVAVTSTGPSAPGLPGAGDGESVVTSTTAPGQVLVGEAAPITVTITVSSTTTFMRATQPASLSAIQPGSVLAVQGQRTGATTFAASSIEILLPTQMGVVTAINGNNATITGFDARTYTVALGSGTVYRRAGQTAAQSDLAVGSLINVEGTPSADGATIDAALVTIRLPQIAGKVTAISGNDVTVETGPGATSTVHLADMTVYHSGKQGAASRGDITTGKVVIAEGTVGADGSLTALSVSVVDLAGLGTGPQMFAVPGDLGGAQGVAGGSVSVTIQGRGPVGGPAFSCGQIDSSGASSDGASSGSGTGI